MKRRAFMGLGATSIGVGALYGTGAFSSVSAGRGVSVNAAEDSSALLGIDDSDSTAPEFTNNTSSFMQVDLEDVPSGANLTFNGNDSFYEFELSTDAGPFSVDIESEDDGDTLVDITATLFESDQKERSIGEVSLRREFEAAEVGQVELDGNISTTGGSGDLTFTLENTGDFDITLSSIGIRETTNDNLDRVDDGELLGTPGPGNNIDERVVDPGATEIPIDNDTLVAFRDLDILELDVGGELELRFDKFNDDPRNADITIELTFEDQSGGLFTLSS